MKKSFTQKINFILILFLTSCAGPRSCFPRFKDLQTQYPKVLYRGPKEPSQVVIQKKMPPHWTPLSQISKQAQWAVLVSEDWAFYQHSGYDEKQIKEAINDSIEEGRFTRGASTITQQVVRNIYLTKEKSLTRKIRELWMATKIEKVLGKKKILELYFNIAEWGEGIFGISEASQFYFQKNPSELNAKEGAFLAMLLPSPKKYSISFRKKELSAYASKTIQSILLKMVQARILTPEEREREWALPLSFEASPSLAEPQEFNEEDSLNESDDEDENNH